MTTLGNSILIIAPVEAVEAVLLDTRRLPEWLVGVERIESSDMFPEQGGAAQLFYSIMGMNCKIVLTSTAFEHNQGFTLQMRGAASGTISGALKPESVGTRVALVVKYRIFTGILGKTIDKLFVEHVISENIENSLIYIKMLAEGSLT